MSKTFKVAGSGIGFEGGRYRGSFATAAKKAGSKLFDKIANSSSFKKFSYKKSIFFILQETTQGSEKKTKAYTVTQVKLDEPVTIMIAGKSITYRFKYEVSELTSSADIEKAKKECSANK